MTSKGGPQIHPVRATCRHHHHRHHNAHHPHNRCQAQSYPRVLGSCLEILFHKKKILKFVFSELCITLPGEMLCRKHLKREDPFKNQDEVKDTMNSSANVRTSGSQWLPIGPRDDKALSATKALSKKGHI